MPSDDTSQSALSRRDALKMLAAITGSAFLAQVPTWHPPLIEVGMLPAHAQISTTIAISSLTRTSISGINNCTVPSGAGTSFALRFQYINPFGDALAPASTLRLTYAYQFINNVGGTLYDQTPLADDQRTTVTGNARAGTVTIILCTRFVNTAGIIDTVTLTSPSGQSITASVTTSAPPGAQGTGDPAQS